MIAKLHAGAKPLPAAALFLQRHITAACAFSISEERIPGAYVGLVTVWPSVHPGEWKWAQL